jgi:hypothetical protein
MVEEWGVEVPPPGCSYKEQFEGISWYMKEPSSRERVLLRLASHHSQDHIVLPILEPRASICMKSMMDIF